MGEWDSRPQGQGPSTRRKQEGLRLLYRKVVRASKGRGLYRRPFWYLETNPGCGWNHEVDCAGSPTTFRDVAERIGRSFRAFFCDCDPAAVHELTQRMAGPYRDPRTTIEVCLGDNVTFLPRMARHIEEAERREGLNPRGAIGCLLCDPNGGGPAGRKRQQRGFERLLAALADFAAAFPKIDLILNLNFSLVARVRGAQRDGQRGFGPEYWPPMDQLDRMLGRLGKQFWMVGNPSRGPRERFALFWGHNGTSRHGRAFGKPGGIWFFPVDSPPGQEIIRTLRNVQAAQPSLFQ